MAAPLWDERQQEFVGMLSAGDFIDIVQIMGPTLASSMTEQELDQHTISMVRDDKAAESGEQPAPLVSVRPEDSLHLVSLTLMQGRLAMAPVLSYGATQPPRGAPASQNTEGDERVDVGEGGGGSGGGGGGGRTPAGPGRC